MGEIIKVQVDTGYLRRLAEGAKAVDDWPLHVAFLAAAEELDELRVQVEELEELARRQRESLEEIAEGAAAAAPRAATRSALAAVRDLVYDHREAVKLTEFVADLLAPGQWRKVHIGFEHRRLTLTLPKGRWLELMARLGFGGQL